MITLLLYIGRWLRDPFGRRMLTHKHENVIRRMYTTKTLTENTVVTIQQHYGVNPIDRVMLGNKMPPKDSSHASQSPISQ